MVFAPFRSENGYRFFFRLGLDSGMVFKGTTGLYSQMNKK